MNQRTEPRKPVETLHLRLYAITDVVDEVNEQPGGIADELGPSVDRNEVEATIRVGEQLARERPAPTPAFRMALRAKLESHRDSADTWLARHLRLAIFACIVCGLILVTATPIRSRRQSRPGLRGGLRRLVQREPTNWRT